jgi:hypothetical protein
MSWAKLDDRFWSNRKVRVAWKTNRASIGLHVMAITYCAMHETDGVVDHDLVETLLPDGRERGPIVNALTNAGLWERCPDDTYRINDYLEYNRSRAEADREREHAAERQRKWRERVSNGVTNALVTEPRNGNPDPTRPDPSHSPPSPPQAGGRKRDRDRYEKDLSAWARAHFPGVDLGLIAHGVSNLRTQNVEPTADALRPWVEKWSA